LGAFRLQFSEEQIGQLYELMEAAKDVYKTCVPHLLHLSLVLLAVLKFPLVLRLARSEEEAAEEESSPVDNLFGPGGKSS
jgi:tellurite resistance protein TehA-like permease